MTSQPFGQQPAFGAPPAPPVETTETDIEEPPRSRRSAVLVLVAGVTVMLVLLGVAALVRGGADPGDDLALPPVPAASGEPPAATASTAPAPLPTSGVQGRNVFIPLVDDEAVGAEGDVVAEVAEDPAAAGAPDPTAPASTDPATTAGDSPRPASAPTDAPAAPAPAAAPAAAPGPGAAPAPFAPAAPVATATVTATTTARTSTTITRTDEALVAELRGQVSRLETRLGREDARSSAEITTLQKELAALREQLRAAEEKIYDATVHLVRVSPDRDRGALTLQVNGTEVTLDLVEGDDAAGTRHPGSVVLYTTDKDVEVELEYLDYTAETGLVMFQVASETHQATLGTTLVWRR